ncbi:MAG: hypothetical protein Q9166_001757 [cf. Caloplaca sp. 2 TL-2023]
MPPFLVDTPASAQIRVAYVQSVISNIITRRIFQPFLFTFDQLDNIFNEWGETLRSKSTKREAVWRQRTLHAAFSCPSSKQRINTFAASVVDEVVAAVKPFADWRKKEQMTAAAKKIIKTAAETWRLARIELSRITASIASDASVGVGGEALLSLFPRIERVPLPKDFRPDSNNDEGCVYTPGRTLFSTSPAMLARRAELGENVTIPKSVQEQEGDARLDSASIRSRSSGIDSQARQGNLRAASPLIPPTRRTQSGRDDAPKLFDEISEDDSRQHKRGRGWLADAQRGSDGYVSTNSRASERDEIDSNSETTVREHAPDHPAGQSPMQSAAHSREHTPQLSRRTTATTTSSTEDDEVYQEAKAGSLPDWGDAGGNVPGAFGGQHDAW